MRTDLKELRDLDLGGAPYGYTPFCDSRTEMDGFRFWKQGYWRNHLQGNLSNMYSNLAPIIYIFQDADTTFPHCMLWILNDLGG